MDARDNIQIGRVVRLGQGWVDVLTDQGMRRVSINSSLAPRAGSYLKIVNKQPVTVLPATLRQSAIQ